MKLRRAVLLLLGATSVRSVYRLELEASETGKNAFPGGDEEATCKACRAVIEHVGRKLESTSKSSEIIGSGKKKAAANKGWERSAKAYNEELHLQAVLDPNECASSMERYDLAFISNQHMFMRRPDGMDQPPYPIHMELNEWGRQELRKFCESLLEEEEEKITELVRQSPQLFERGGDPSVICKDELDLCRPPPPPPKDKQLSRKERKEKSASVFASMDKDSNGEVTYEELLKHETQLRMEGKGGPEPEEWSGKSAEWKAAKSRQRVRETITKLDRNGDGKVNLKEYGAMWGLGKKKTGSTPAAVYVHPGLLDTLRGTWRELAAAPSYVHAAAVTVTTGAVYVGGVAARVW
jgi:hypothetical protein